MVVVASKPEKVSMMTVDEMTNSCSYNLDISLLEVPDPTSGSEQVMASDILIGVAPTSGQVVLTDNLTRVEKFLSADNDRVLGSSIKETESGVDPESEKLLNIGLGPIFKGTNIQF